MAVGNLVGLILVVTEMGRADEAAAADVLEMERFARNGAALSKALHMAAHGDLSRAGPAHAYKAEYVKQGAAIVQEASDEDPECYSEAAAALGGFEAAGRHARWMVDKVDWAPNGDIVLPEPGASWRGQGS